MKCCIEFPREPSRERGSSLIISLLVIVILSTIVVAFMQSMAVERLVAKSSLNTYRARLAADAGVTESLELMRDLFQKYPDSATAWVTNMGPSALSANRTPGTAFYYYEQVSVTNATIGSLTNILQYRPLVSGATNVAFANRTNALSAYSSPTNYVNLNSTTYGGGRLWIGTPPNWSGSSAYRVDVPWVELKDASGKVVSRYAFWIDDESFRVNINEATNIVRGSSSLGLSPSEMPLQGVAKVASTNDAALLANNIAGIRNQSSFGGQLSKLRNINYANTAYPTLSDSMGFVSSISSSGLNISRTGARRVNLNGIVATNTVPTDASTIQDQLDLIRTTITNQAPLFGQRFFRTVGSVNATNSTAAETEIYLTKLAANIRDYIDSDSQPTLVETGGAIPASGPPALAIPSGELWAIGKENVPRLQESFVHVQQLVNMAAAGSPSPWAIRIAYYFEFWNMGTTDITVSDLGPNAFLRVANQPEWYDAGTGALKISLPPDFQIPLADFVNSSTNQLVFRAGAVTVLTTDPNPSATGTFLPSSTLASVYRPNPGNPALITALNTAPHYYSSATLGNLPVPSGGGFGGFGTLVLSGRQGTPNSSPGSAENNWDAETEVILGNDIGWLESHPSSVIIRPGIYVDGFSAGNPNLKFNKSNFHWRGGALIGNVATPYPTVYQAPPFQVGDPRANNEQIAFSDPSFTGRTQTAFSRWRSPSVSQSAVSSDQKSTMGATNSFFTSPGGGVAQWDEGNNPRTSSDLAGGGSPAFVRNGTMQSIGELGHIYDPLRIIVAAGDKTSTAGGGRTLRIGRPETVPATPGSGLVLSDTNSLSVSRRWAAWRLTDIFSTRDDPKAATTPEKPSGIPGLINPNGALRDGGAAMLAALEGFAYSQDNALTDSPLKGLSFGTNTYNFFRSTLTNWLNTGMPFFERGELSELGAFNLNLQGTLSSNPGISTLTANDRSREEIFRRLVEMVTTKGNTFTVYVVGQAVTTLPNGTRRVDSTQTRKVTFRLQPQYASNLDFDPSPSSVSARLAAPTNYVFQILSQTDN